MDKDQISVNEVNELAAHLGVDIATARQMLANKQLQETRILQKVYRATREAFSERYPGQIEHCLRLIMERLQLGLDKRGGVDPGKPSTWAMSAEEISALASAANCIDQMRHRNIVSGS